MEKKQVRLYEEKQGEKGLSRRIRRPVEDFKEGRKHLVIDANIYIERNLLFIKEFGYNYIEVGSSKSEYNKLFVSNKDKPVFID